mmetsp:Transcript_98640/g.205644  ORF Transcript_98640/g.205644 Transcript_98640/m.205644 type:complete len:878 (-) Transcript_98640:281-2914(-)
MRMLGRYCSNGDAKHCDSYEMLDSLASEMEESYSSSGSSSSSASSCSADAGGGADVNMGGVGSDLAKPQRQGFIQVLGREIDLDDDNVVIVMIFPRGTSGGAIDPLKPVYRPRHQAGKLFRYQGAIDEDSQCGELPENGSEVTQSVYQKVVRTKILRDLHSLGLTLLTFESIDGDESYLKIGIDPRGGPLRHMAACYRYHLPLTREAYQDVKNARTGHADGVPAKNADGLEVMAYHEYTENLWNRGVLQQFREVDIIRIVTRSITDHFNLDEMVKQKVISRWFVAANYDRTVTLSEKWVRSWWFCLPSDPDECVREYFGEEVTFFFLFFAFYIRMLAFLAFAAIVTGVVQNRLVARGIEVGVASTVPKLAFGIFLSIWTMAVQVRFNKKLARCRQRWNVDGGGATVDPVLPSYRPELDGTKRLAFQRALGYGIVASACALFGVTWGQIAMNCSKTQEAVLTSLLIRVCSLLWGYIVPYISKLHNHRTQRRKTKTMTVQLAVFKLFLYLMPFIRTSFVVSWTQMTCHSTMGEVVKDIFNETSPRFPQGLVPEMYELWMRDYTVPDWALNLKGINTTDPETAVCAWGCYPHKCRPQRLGDGSRRKHVAPQCETNCAFGLRKSLDGLYFTHVLFTLLFLGIAIGLSYWKCREELKHASGADKKYSFLQFQAKCDEVARYDYLSWGGSYVEDFLEVVLGFALLSCFAMVRPLVCVWVLVAQAIEYRMLAYRMTHVTCRPYPTGASGIEMWQRMMTIVCMLSVLINAGLAISLLPLFSAWNIRWKFLFFFVYSLTMLISRMMFEIMSRGRPSDVSRIEDFNLVAMSQVARGEGQAKMEHCLHAPEVHLDVGLEGHANSQDHTAVSVTSTEWRISSFSLLDRL